MQGTETADLIAALEAERTRRKLDHRAFSTLLGIHESGWNRIRLGRRQPTLETLTKILQKLPELSPQVTIFIMRQGNDGENQRTPLETGVKKESRPLTTRKEGK